LLAIIQETLHKHTGDVTNNSIETVEDPLASTDAQEKSQGGSGAFLQLFKNWPLMSAIILYSIFSLQDVAYAEVKLPDVCCLVFFLFQFRVIFIGMYNFLVLLPLCFVLYLNQKKPCRYFLSGLSVTGDMVD
jgi:hypothetical protein